MIETALKFDKPVRIGVNWGSLDQELLTGLMDENAKLETPKDARAVMHEAIVQSALLSTERANELGMSNDKIILSAKVSAVQDLIAVYRLLASRSNNALHLGLTEAGMGSKGIVASTAGLAILLQEGLGDTIRISLTQSLAATAQKKCKWGKRFCNLWALELLCLWSRLARAVGAQPAPFSKSWRKIFKTT